MRVEAETARIQQHPSNQSERQRHGEPEVQVMTPTQQETIPFYGHELVAVVLEDGTICAVMRYLCDSLQLDMSGQLQRIQRKTALRQGVVRVWVTTTSGVQDMPALTLKVLPGYLFTIDEHRVKEEAREDVVRFQMECVEALAEYFRRKRGSGGAVPAVVDLPSGRIVESALASPIPGQLLDAQRATQIGEIAEQIVQLTGVIGFLREHMQALLTLPGQVEAIATQLTQALTLLGTLTERQEATEIQLATTQAQVAAVDHRTKGLTTAHKRAIMDQVQDMVRLTKGQMVPLTYQTIYGPLNRRYHAASYGDITDERFDDAMSFLREMLRQATQGAASEQGTLF